MKKLIIALLVLVVIFLVTISVFPCSIKNGIFKNNNACELPGQKGGPINSEKLTDSKISTSTTTPSRKTETSTKLQRLSALNEWETLFKDLEKSNLYINNEYLVITQQFSGKDKNDLGYEEVWSINLKTGKSNLVYKHKWTNYDNQISKIAEFQNALYIFSEGMYGNGPVRVVNFPLENNNVLEMKFPGESIKEIAGNYWITGFGGDGCISGNSYYLYDPKTKSVLGSIYSESNCDGGSYLFIFKNQAINVYYNERYESQKIGSSTIAKKLPIVYTKVIKTDLSDFKKAELISEKDMPEGITKIAYNEKNDTLQLLGGEKYVFDLKTGMLVKKDFSESVVDNSSANSSSQMEISPMTTYTSREVIQKLKAMNLPSGYRLITVEK